MQFLKKNKIVFLVLCLIPVFIIYFDKSIMIFIKDFQASYLNIYPFFEFLDTVMDFFYNSVVVLVVLILIFALYSFIKRKPVGKPLILGMILTTITVNILKHIIGRTRPKFGFDTYFKGPSMSYLYSSFPSGHTAFSFMLATILSQYYPRYCTLFYFLAVWVGFERVEDFAHFPSDVIAGALIGFITGKLTLKLVLNRTKQHENEISSK